MWKTIGNPEVTKRTVKTNKYSNDRRGEVLKEAAKRGIKGKANDQQSDTDSDTEFQDEQTTTLLGHGGNVQQSSFAGPQAFTTTASFSQIPTTEAAGFQNVSSSSFLGNAVDSAAPGWPTAGTSTAAASMRKRRHEQQAEDDDSELSAQDFPAATRGESEGRPMKRARKAKSATNTAPAYSTDWPVERRDPGGSPNVDSQASQRNDRAEDLMS